MAVKELAKSREQRITQRTESIVRKFSCSAEDWENWPYKDVPQLGYYWSINRQDLRVASINNRWTTQNEMVVDVTYTNRASRYRNSWPNTYQSLSEDIDVSEQPLQLAEDDPYYNMEVDSIGDFVEPHVKKWDAAHTGFDEGEVPTIPPTFAARMVVNIKQNQEGWDYTKVKAALGCVNSGIFLPHYIDTYYGGQYRNINWRTRINYGDPTETAQPDDIGFWLFTHFSAHNTGDGNWELNYQFTNSGYWAWNNPYNIETFLYLTYDFNNLPFPIYNLDNMNIKQTFPGR